MKKCPKCKEEKEFSEFYKDKRTKDNLRAWCKICNAKYNKKYKKSDKWKKYNRNYKYNRTHKDINFHILLNIRSRLYFSIKNKKKENTTLELLGCSIKFLKKYLESNFQSGMSWDNYGKNGWEIDHIKPCASFDLSKTEEQRKCFHYTNLQPLWAEDNKKKHSTYNVRRNYNVYSFNNSDKS